MTVAGVGKSYLAYVFPQLASLLCYVLSDLMTIARWLLSIYWKNESKVL